MEKVFWMVVNDATMVACKLINMNQTLAIRDQGPFPKLPPPQNPPSVIEEVDEEEEVAQLV